MLSGIGILSPITGNVGIRLVEAAGPLPHVACHVLCAIRTSPRRVAADWGGSAFLPLSGVAASLVEGIPPRIDPADLALGIPPGRFLPCRLCGQAPGLAGGLG